MKTGGTPKVDIRTKRSLNIVQNEPKTHSLSLNSPTKVYAHHRDASKDSIKENKGGKSASIDLRAFLSPRRPIKLEETPAVKEKKVMLSLSIYRNIFTNIYTIS